MKHESPIDRRALLVLAGEGTKRLPTSPDVPTLLEAGYGNFDASFWVGLAVPKHTPEHAVRKLNAALNAALAQTQVKAHAQANGWELVGGPQKALADAIAHDLAELPPLIKRLDIKAG